MVDAGVERLILVGGVTQTAQIDGISAAGKNPEVMVHTPSADLEIVEYGDTVLSPVVPVSPSGCPSPAFVTRAARELHGFELTAINAGLAEPTGTSTKTLGTQPGGDIRDTTPVPNAKDLFEDSKKLAQKLPDSAIAIGETIPGGTTTALGVLTALDGPTHVSSSLPKNPIKLKRDVVEQGLEKSTIDSATDDPIQAIREIGDPVLAVVTGLAKGALDTNTEVMLAGGTQMVAVATALRKLGSQGYGNQLEIATTTYISSDETAKIKESTDRISTNLLVTDPGFEQRNHPILKPYIEGEAKEGVGMGGALAIAKQNGIEMEAVRQRTVQLYEKLV